MNDRVYADRDGELFYCEYVNEFEVFLIAWASGYAEEPPYNLDVIAVARDWVRLE